MTLSLCFLVPANLRADLTVAAGKKVLCCCLPFNLIVWGKMQVLRWIRTSREHRGLVVPSPRTGGEKGDEQ